jgi:hypothetical protein
MQCDYITSTGQCAKEAVPPGRFCENHSQTSARTLVGQYLIANKMVGEPADRHAAADNIKSVIGEIALLRALLERRINQVNNDVELVAIMPQVKDFTLAIDKLTTNLHTMDVKLGNLLSKTALLSLAQELVTIINRHLRPLIDTTPDKNIVDEITEEIGHEIVTTIASMENL